MAIEAPSLPRNGLLYRVPGSARHPERSAAESIA
jgi:hypothetical protein